MRGLIPALEKAYPGRTTFKVQTDKCPSFASGINAVNAEYGYQKLELMFRGQDDRNPMVRP